MKIGSLLAAAAAALTLAAAAPASTGGWVTEAHELHAAKTTGVTYGGTTAPILAGFCHGLGTARGFGGTARYRAFRCTIVFNTGAGTSWWDVKVTSAMQVVKIYGRF